MSRQNVGGQKPVPDSFTFHNAQLIHIALTPSLCMTSTSRHHYQRCRLTVHMWHLMFAMYSTWRYVATMHIQLQVHCSEMFKCQFFSMPKYSYTFIEFWHISLEPTCTAAATNFAFLTRANISGLKMQNSSSSSSSIFLKWSE